MKYLYDTDSTIDYFKDIPTSRTTYQSLLPDGIAISGIMLIELYTGTYASPDTATAERQLKDMLGSLTMLSLNQRVIRQTAQLRHELLTRGLSIRRRAYDLIVAATALAYDLTLITSNTRDYQDIAGLRQLDPRSGQVTIH